MSTGKKAIKATIFVALNSYASNLVAFVSGVALRRILGAEGPRFLGTYRLALFFLDLFGRIKEFGLDKALIHKQDDLEASYRTHFTLQAGLSLLVLLAIIIASPLILKYYSSTILIFLIILALFSLFQALSTTQRISLEKNLQFGQTSLVDIISLALGSALSILLAFRGFGALSFVVGYGAPFLFTFIFLWWLRPWRIPISQLLLFDRQRIGWFFKFSIFLFFGGLTTFALYRFNDFLLGTYLSFEALGYYSTAFNYAQLPTSLITSVISRVALPTYSALQSDHQKLEGAFAIVLKSIVRISFPLSLVLFMTADDFIVALLGTRWIPMIPIFKVLLIYGLARSIFDDLGELFTAVGKPGYVSFYLFVQAVISLALGPFLISRYGAVGAAYSLSTILVIGVLLAYFLLRRIIKFNVWLTFLPTIIICLLTYVTFKLTVFHFHLESSQVWTNLILKGIVFTILYLFFMALIDGRSFVGDLRFMLAHLRIKEETEVIEDEEESLKAHDL